MDGKQKILIMGMKTKNKETCRLDRMISEEEKMLI